MANETASPRGLLIGHSVVVKCLFLTSVHSISFKAFLTIGINPSYSNHSNL